MGERKYCPKCQATKPVGDFHRHRREKDGRQSHCKDCQRAHERANREKRAAYGQAYRQRHPKKRHARNAISNAIRDGELKRPDRCEDCGGVGQSDSGIQAHHEDYSKPLDVKWLCRDCHSARHARMRTQGATA